MTYLRAFAIVAAIVVSFASAGTAAPQRSQLKVALTQCLSEAIALDAFVELDLPPNAPKPSEVMLSCSGTTAAALFTALELVSEQALKSNSPPFADSVSRKAGNISCIMLLESRSTFCSINIVANPAFVDQMRP